jgi:hypothetical protein
MTPARAAFVRREACAASRCSLGFAAAETRRITAWTIGLLELPIPTTARRRSTQRSTNIVSWPRRPWFWRRLSGKPGGWREVVLNRQQLDFSGDQISPAKRSIAARQPYTTSVLRRPARVCGFSTRPFLCPTATARCSTWSALGVSPAFMPHFWCCRLGAW